MLNPNNNRLDYGSILSPPENYELDFAIGTTYSLDLDSLIGASISLGLSEKIDSELLNQPTYLLGALRKTSDKIALFCESGQIHAPNTPTKLYILLENSVFQIATSKSKKTRYPSFHPKIWLIRYKNNEDEPLYRIIILSRNLTFDRSWDISFTMDGKKVKDDPIKTDKTPEKSENYIKTDKNEELIILLKYLREFTTDDNKTNKITSIIKELEYINFELNSDEFYDYDFIINGINDDYTIENYPLFTDKLNELLIMSPFLSNSVINDFNKRVKSNKCCLITQHMSLGKLNPENCSNFEIYTMKDEIIDGEYYISDEEKEIFKQDIHAKLFLIKKGGKTDLYLGSLNASHNSIRGNIEFMIRLKSKRRGIYQKILDSIFYGKKEDLNNPFKLIDKKSLLEKDISENNNLNSIIKEINRLKPKSRVINKDDTYDIELTIDNLDSIRNKNINLDEIKISINPLFVKRELEIAEKIVYKDLNKLELSEFYIIKVEKESIESNTKEKESIESNTNETLKRIIKIPTENMPKDREEEVINYIIKDKESFITYVSFLLGDETIITQIDTFNKNKANSYSNSFELQIPALYEKMLKMAYYNPKRFKEINYLIKSISNNNVIPEGFEELYKTFEEAIK